MNWNLIENNLVNISFALLFVTLIMYWINIAFTDLSIFGQIGYILTIFINVCIGNALLFRWLNNGYFPSSNLYESLIFLTWGLTTVHLILEYKNKSKLIGAINIPIALFTIAFASLSLSKDIQQAEPLVPALRSNWLMMHVSIMIMSYATLITGSLLSILFLIMSKGENINLQGSATNYKIKNIEIIYKQDNINRSNNANVIIKNNRMSLLQSIDNLSYRTIGLGFPLLTIGIVAGAVWANEVWGSYWSWDPKETWALITWLVFAAYLHSRLTKSWQGKKPAILASIGFIVVWICYLGVNFLGKGLHSYGWVL